MSSTPPQDAPNEPNGAPAPAPAPQWWANAPTPMPPQTPYPPNYSGAPSYPLTPQYPQSPSYPQAPQYGQPPAYPTYPPSQQSPSAPYGAPASPSKPLGEALSDGLQEFGRAAMASVPLLASAVAAVNQMTAPQQDVTAISPAPFAAQALGWTHSQAITDQQLGDWSDGWYDTVKGMAEKAPLMIQALVDDLPTHFRPSVTALSTRLGMTGVSSLAKGVDLPSSPAIVVRVAKSIPAAITALPRLILRVVGITIVGKQRDYLFAVTTPGAKVGVTITGAGNDLYVAWDLYLRRVWNEVIIGLIATIALVFGVLLGLLPNGILGFIVVTLYVFFGMVAAGAFAGLVFRRDATALLRKHGDMFERHDIQSMTLSVDKALRAAADKAGIDSKLLRGKQDFVTEQGSRVI